MAKKVAILIGIILFTFSAICQNHTLVYKTIDTLNLELEVITPPNMDKNKAYPAMVFFFLFSEKDTHFRNGHLSG